MPVRWRPPAGPPGGLSAALPARVGSRRRPDGGHQPVAVEPRPGWPARSAGRRSATAAPRACAGPRPACGPGRPWPRPPRPARPGRPAPRACCSRRGASASSAEASSSSATDGGGGPGAVEPGGHRSPLVLAGHEPGVADQQPGPVEAPARGPGHRLGRASARHPGPPARPPPRRRAPASKGTCTHRLTMVARLGREVVGQQHEHRGRRGLLHRLQQGRGRVAGPGGRRSPPAPGGTPPAGRRWARVTMVRASSTPRAAPVRSTAPGRDGSRPGPAGRCCTTPHPPSGHSRAAARPRARGPLARARRAVER